MKSGLIDLPENKRFAFTIIDDTDEAYLENIEPVYDLLYRNNLRITKTVWVYPSRNTEESNGDCLQSDGYLKFIRDIYKKGFEIALHNIGSGDYYRGEIISGLTEFYNKLGFYPRIHVNHSYNKDNIYWGHKRFTFPLNILIKNMYKSENIFSGENPDSDFFWGDYHKKLIKYTRNYDIDEVNSFKRMPYMPFRVKSYEDFSNYWFGATFASNPWLFNLKITEYSIKKLEKERGICILNTHLGLFMQNNKIDPGFKKMIEFIGSRNGWFVPVGTLLDFLNENKSQKNVPEFINSYSKLLIELHSLFTRIKYRYILKLDDQHFGKTLRYGKQN